MKMRLLFTTLFICATACTFWYLNKEQIKTNRLPSSQNETLGSTRKEQNFLRASYLFEAFSTLEINKDEVEFYRPYREELEQNLTTKDKATYWLSLTSLLFIHHKFENAPEFRIVMNALFSDQRRCEDVKECLFYINIIAKVAEQFESENLHLILSNTNSELSPFWNLLKKNININEISYQSAVEEEYFKFIHKSILTHIHFNADLKRDLHPIKHRAFFDLEKNDFISESIEELHNEYNEFDITPWGEEISNENHEVAEFLIDPNYSISKLQNYVDVWNYRNTLLGQYLERFKYRSLRDWVDKNKEGNENVTAILQRYSWFEAKLPTRRDLLTYTKTEEEWNKKYIEFIESIEESIISYARKNYPQLEKFQEDNLILKAEQDLFQDQIFKQRAFFGWYYDMQLNLKLSLEYTKEANEHLEKVNKNSVVYHATFDYYHKLQAFDFFWIQGQCQVGQYIHDLNPPKTMVTEWQTKDRFISPLSNKKYYRSDLCKDSIQELQKEFTQIFGIKKAMHAAADEFLIGKSSTFLSVIGYISAYKITAKAMAPILHHTAKKYSAKKASLAYIQSIKNLNRNNIVPWLKYVAAPALIIDYAISGITMAFIRSSVTTLIDLSTGKTLNFANAFGNYLRTYTIMYLSMPPVGYFMTKAGNAINIFRTFLPASKGSFSLAKNIKIPQNVTKFIGGAVDQLKITVTETVTFMPVFYINDIIDYVEKGKEFKPSLKQFAERTELIASWLVTWQFLDHVATKRFGPTPQAVISHTEQINRGKYEERKVKGQ